MLDAPDEYAAADGGHDDSGNRGPTQGDRARRFGEQPSKIDRRKKIQHPEHSRRLQLQRKRNTRLHQWPREEKDRDKRRAARE